MKSLIQQNTLCIVCSEIWFTLLLVDNGEAVHDFHCFGFKSKQSSLALGVIRKYKEEVGDSWKATVLSESQIGLNH